MSTWVDHFNKLARREDEKVVSADADDTAAYIDDEDIYEDPSNIGDDSHNSATAAAAVDPAEADDDDDDIYANPTDVDDNEQKIKPDDVTPPASPTRVSTEKINIHTRK